MTPRWNTLGPESRDIPPPPLPKFSFFYTIRSGKMQHFLFEMCGLNAEGPYRRILAGTGR